MTPKNKAEKLVESFKNIILYDFVSDLTWKDPSPNNAHYHERIKKDAKKCALKTVSEIIESLEYYDEITNINLQKEYPEFVSSEKQNMDKDFRYWDKVKIEIEKL